LKLVYDYDALRAFQVFGGNCGLKIALEVLQDRFAGIEVLDHRFAGGDRVSCGQNAGERSESDKEGEELLHVD
jgi:hypothetical protein